MNFELLGIALTILPKEQLDQIYYRMKQKGFKVDGFRTLEKVPLPVIMNALYNQKWNKKENKKENEKEKYDYRQIFLNAVRDVVLAEPEMDFEKVTDDLLAGFIADAILFPEKYSKEQSECIIKRTEELKEKDNMLKKSTKSNANVEEDIFVLLKEIEFLKEENKKCNEQNSVLKEQNRKYKEQRDELKVQIRKQEEINNKFNNKKAKLERGNQNKEKTIQELEIAIQELKIEKNQVLEENKSILKELQNYENKVDFMQNEYGELKKRFDQNHEEKIRNRKNVLCFSSDDGVLSLSEEFKIEIIKDWNIENIKKINWSKYDMVWILTQYVPYGVQCDIKSISPVSVKVAYSTKTLEKELNIR